ncbi:MAG: hypothetical protein RLZ98_1331 [Pseudomonadota bacterium]
MDRKRTLAVIAVHSGAGAGDMRTSEGPRALFRAGLVRTLSDADYVIERHDIARDAWCPDAATLPFSGRLLRVVEVAGEVARLLQETVGSGRRFLVLGGDHSIAVGTWSGVRNAYPDGRGPGLLWFDAHLDSHVPATTPSGNLHGMPIAHLLGHGVAELTDLSEHGPAIDSERLAIIGVRSFEPEEPVLLGRQGVRIYDMTEVRSRGADMVADEAIARVNGAAGFGVSIDLDCIDPALAPGVGSPVTDGFSEAEFMTMMRSIGSCPGFMGAEIVEYNPARDQDGRTGRLALRIIATLFAAAPDASA